MPSIISKPTTRTIRVKQTIRRLRPEELAHLPKTLAETRRWLKAMGAKPIDAATKRRLIAAGEWGMPKE